MDKKDKNSWRILFWPLEYSDGTYKLNPKYNLERGGTKYKRRGSYIEDRVD